ncbi:MAG: SOS response-associated peptidase [Chloroflexi bacterium]|nr:MAG: SOS response-associated peptidase [Chloroflexota bacterium]
MCGRFALTTPGEALATLFGLEQPPPVVPRYNIAPTQPVLAVRLNPRQEREMTFFRWGLIPPWVKDISVGSRMINARAETVDEKPSFRAAFKRRRCLIPASGFYEWQRINGRKQPLFIHPVDDQPFVFAGLWETWFGPDGSEVDSCTILTTTPNALMQEIHNRMPVILEPDEFDAWLFPDLTPDGGRHLLRPYPADKMTAYPVSTYVNNPHNEGPQCIARIAI